jgi:hypothetical protein
MLANKREVGRRDYIQRWPCPTLASWDVCEVANNQSTVVSVLALEPDTISANSVGVKKTCGINAHVYLIVLVSDEALLFGLSLVNVVDVSIWESQSGNTMLEDAGRATNELGPRSA